jgi:hypothetical protein
MAYMKLNRSTFSLTILVCLSISMGAGISGCAGRASQAIPSGSAPLMASTAPVDIVEQAAAQATAIIQQARATALVLQAQSEATNLVSQAGAAAPESATPLTPADTNTLPAAQDAPAQGTPTPGNGDDEPALTPQGTAGDAVEILRVTYGADGAYIVVNFTSTAEAAQTFWPGVLSVTDEASGAIYNEVPVMPLIGPLIARPREKGQPGYVMLVNAPIPIQPGTLVTVILGEYRFEHLPVQ